MRQTHTRRQKMRQLFVILGPILVTQVALSLMNFADTVMSGRFAAVDLAGVAIGSSIWMPVFTGITGILMALTPIIAQLFGAGRTDGIAPRTQQGLYLSVVLAGGVLVVGRFLLPVILNGMQLEPEVHRIAAEYLHALAWGIVPLFAYSVLRSFMDALGQTRATMAITLLSLPINVVLNYVLIFGPWGLPAYGGVGAGYASALTYWIIAIIAAVFVLRVQPFARYRVFAGWPAVRLAAWAEQLRIGVPIGFAIFLEVGVFAGIALLMSSFGTVTLAAHQAASNFGGLLYMVPMSMSSALTIAVGYEVGAGRIDDADEYGRIGIVASVAMALLSATFLLAFRARVAGWYTNETEVRLLLESFLFYVLFFQLSDAVAAPIQGILRGFKDVNVTLMVAIVAYWFVGFPGGYLLANYTSLGPYGYWIGLISGLAAGAVGLALRLAFVRRQFARRADGPRPHTVSPTGADS